MKAPIRRSHFRLKIGQCYYTWLRRLNWMFSNTMFAKKRQNELLDFIIFQHQTPLIRKLKDVDMWMQVNKVHNLKLAIERLNGLLVQQGETMSYWRLIGKPTRRKGYKEGMVLTHGTFKAGVGGGLCQLSNLIYWMTLHTPLTIIERHRHSYDVFPDSNRTQPFGSGATCAYNYIDLQIQNNTSATWQLHLNLTESHLQGQWRCTQPATHVYEVYEANHKITQEVWGGYVRHNEIRRRIFSVDNHELIGDEAVTENHAVMMYSPMLQDHAPTNTSKS